MIRNCFSVLLIAVCCSVHAEETPVAKPLAVNEMVIVAIDVIEVPASAPGVIAEIGVREGNNVVTGQVLGKLDDRQARIEEAMARTQLQIVQKAADESLAIDLANKKLELAKQLAKQQEVVRDMATRKAKNEVRTLASMKAEAVAKNELDRAVQARQQFADSISKSEIDSLRLAYEKSRLETQQADFERLIDGLQAKVEQEVEVAQTLGIERSEIEVAQATSENLNQRLEVELEKQRTSLAELTTERHKITSPINGVIVQRLRGQGEWVTTGDPILKIIRLDRLRAEGFVKAEEINSLRANRTVELSIQTSADTAIQREGTIVFISPELDPVNKEVRFWVEFDNSAMDVLPGMRLNLSSKP